MKRLNKTKGMYALLIVVATMIGVTIYVSCSADEDYDGYSSDDELFTLAEKEMTLRYEPYYSGMYVLANIAHLYLEELISSEYVATVTLSWTTGWTGNNPYLINSAVTSTIVPLNDPETINIEGTLHEIYCNEYSALWKTSKSIELTYKYIDKNLRTQYVQSKTFKKTYDYEELLEYCEVDTSVIN